MIMNGVQYAEHVGQEMKRLRDLNTALMRTLETVLPFLEEQESLGLEMPEVRQVKATITKAREKTDMCTELKIRVRQLTKDTPGVKVTVTCEPDITDVRGNVSASGDDAYDKQIEDETIRRMRHNVWAWCSVKVEMTYLELSACDYLGGCSYEDEDEFKQGDEYEDMVNVCLEEIQSRIDEIVQKNAVIA